MNNTAEQQNNEDIPKPEDLPQTGFKPLEEYTELGNSKRWIRLYGHLFTWVSELKTWFFWDGTRWKEDNSNTLTKSIDGTLQSIKEEEIIMREEIKILKTLLNIESLNHLREVLDELNQPTDEHLHLMHLYESGAEAKKWYKASQSARRIRDLFDISSRYKETVSYSSFDSKGKYLGVKNGVINLTTGEHIIDDPRYLISNSCHATFDSDATCPNFMKTIHKALQGDQSVINFFQLIIGQCALGEADVSHLIILSGSGANLKSTIIDTIHQLLGDYASVTTPDAIMGGGRTNKEYYIADLKGKRCALINESSRGARLDEQMVKMLVDSGEVQARRLYCDPFAFQPVATPILITNFPPAVSTDYAMARRIHFIPFKYQVPEGERNPNYRKDFLEPEMSGILNWVIEGAIRYLQVGKLEAPPAIEKATSDYFFENDKVRQFIADHYEISPMDKVPSKKLYMEFVIWCGEKGVRSFSQKRLNDELRVQTYDVSKSTGGVFYVFGLKAKTPPPGSAAANSPAEKARSAMRDIESKKLAVPGVPGAEY